MRDRESEDAGERDATTEAISTTSDQIEIQFSKHAEDGIRVNRTLSPHPTLP